MTAWSRGTNLGADAFADRFFGRAATDPVVETLHSAALDVSLAGSHAELRKAAEKVADVMQAVGLDHWPRFLADAQARAGDVAATRLDAAAPVPFADDKGQAMLNYKGGAMMRPAGMAPHFFVS